MAIRVKRVINTSKVLVLVVVVAGLDPFGVGTVKLLAKLLTKPFAFDTLLVEKNVVVDGDDLFDSPSAIYACKMCH